MRWKKRWDEKAFFVPFFFSEERKRKMPFPFHPFFFSEERKRKTPFPFHPFFFSEERKRKTPALSSES
jgi:hypothetical protein